MNGRNDLSAEEETLVRTFLHTMKVKYDSAVGLAKRKFAKYIPPAGSEFRKEQLIPFLNDAKKHIEEERKLAEEKIEFRAQEERRKSSNTRIAQRTLNTYEYNKENVSKQNKVYDIYRLIEAQLSHGSKYNTNVSDRTLTAELPIEVSFPEMNKASLFKMVRAILPEVDITQAYIDECIEYYNTIHPIVGAYIKGYTNPYTTMVYELLIHDTYTTVPNAYNVLQTYTGKYTESFHCIISVGPGDKPYSILIPDKAFKTKFITKPVVIFVFERDDVGWSAITKGNIKTSSLYSYLQKEYPSDSPDSYAVTELAPNILSITFLYRSIPIEIVYLNTYYIGIYKPLLSHILKTADDSLCIDATSAHSPLFQNDLFIRGFFNYFMFAPYGIRGLSYNTNTHFAYRFLLNLKKTRELAKPVQERIFKTIEGFITKFQNVGPEEWNDIVRTLQDDYSEVVQLIGKTSGGESRLWTIMNGGRRKTRRRQRQGKSLKRRRQSRRR